MGKLLKTTLIVAILAFLGERIIHFTHRFTYFREVEPVDLPNCQYLKGVEFGSEDIDILPNGLAFISSGLKNTGAVSFAPDKPGEIFLLDLNDGNLQPFPLPIRGRFDASSFNPHGICTYIDEKDDTVYLFVVNHPNYQTTVEIFKFAEEENVLVHLKTIKHALLHSVNDIAAVGPESFYATNDFYFTNFYLKLIELLFGLQWSSVSYYSPGNVKRVASGFYSTNGIAMSADKKYVYVADLTGHTVSVFQKDADWSLSPVKVVELETALDNLSVDPVTGDIWIGAIPNGMKALVYNPEDVPGSEVIRIQNIHSDNPIVTTVYANNGSVLQLSTSASVYEGKLLIGTIFHKALYCELD
ncbi:serum paraoxonase/arylesterase 2-like [Pseudophryne corroboree]|uniref:serum paraoxonase/arylesterase 2-like n=1 Tax=Pseudophryne corroboree TaxID=495146 RepID=UPI00308134C9